MCRYVELVRYLYLIRLTKNVKATNTGGFFCVELVSQVPIEVF